MFLSVFAASSLNLYVSSGTREACEINNSANLY